MARKRQSIYVVLAPKSKTKLHRMPFAYVEKHSALRRLKMLRNQGEDAFMKVGFCTLTTFAFAASKGIAAIS